MKKALMVWLMAAVLICQALPAKAELNAIDFVQISTKRLVIEDPYTPLWSNVKLDVYDSQNCFLITNHLSIIYADLQTLDILSVGFTYDDSTDSLIKSAACIAALEWPEYYADAVFESTGSSDSPLETAKSSLLDWLDNLTEDQKEQIEQGDYISIRNTDNWHYYLGHVLKKHPDDPTEFFIIAKPLT